MAKFLSLNLLYAFTTFGFSIRQGRHQLAQKSTKTYLPLKELKETGLSFTSGRVNSGAGLFNKELAAACCVCCACCVVTDLFKAARASCFGNFCVALLIIEFTSSAEKPSRPKAG